MIFNCAETNFLKSNNVYQVFCFEYFKIFRHIYTKLDDKLANIITIF